MIAAELGREEPGVSSYTLLHHAVQSQKSQMTFYLLKSIKPDVIDERGRTPLHYGFKGNDSCAQMLLSHGADISSRDNKGWTPLHVASYHGASKSVSSLLNAGAEIDARDNAGMTPLDHCALSFYLDHKTHSEAMTVLLQASASFSSFKKNGYTPLQFAMVTAIRFHSESALSGILIQPIDVVSTSFRRWIERRCILPLRRAVDPRS